jgi:hypothetical protein
VHARKPQKAAKPVRKPAPAAKKPAKKNRGQTGGKKAGGSESRRRRKRQASPGKTGQAASAPATSKDRNRTKKATMAAIPNTPDTLSP